MENDVVSVVMITYGHENFIEEAINGVLMQECSFGIELIVSSDCSPDNTDEVVRNIIKHHQRGDRIKYICHEKNIGMMSNSIFSLNEAKNKYIALCEGDDYWTDPLKLQKQVDFMEGNLEFSFCCHRYQIYAEYDNKFDTEIYPLQFIPYNYDLKGVVVDKTVFHSNWITQPLTSLLRRSALNKVDVRQFKYFRDVHLFYVLLIKDKGFCHEWIAGVYRKHEGGVHTGSNNADRRKDAFLIAEELYLFSKENEFIKMYLGNSIALLKDKKHLKILIKSFFVNLSNRDKYNMLKFTFQYFIRR